MSRFQKNINNQFKTTLILFVSFFFISPLYAATCLQKTKLEQVYAIAIVKDVTKLYNRSDLSVSSIIGKDPTTGGTIVTINIDNNKIHSLANEENTILIEGSTVLQSN